METEEGINSKAYQRLEMNSLSQSHDNYSTVKKSQSNRSMGDSEKVCDVTRSLI